MEIFILINSSIWFVLAFKTLQILQSILWLYDTADPINSLIKNHDNGSLDNKSYTTKYTSIGNNFCDKNKGNFFPFGYKDYLIQKAIDYDYNHSRIKFFQNQIKFFLRICKYLFRYQRLSPITCFYTLILSSFVLDKIEYSTITIKIFGFTLLALILTIVLDNILLTIEAITAYSLFESYAAIFHAKKEPKSYILAEISLFFKKLVSAILSSTTLCYVGQCFFKAFSIDSNNRFSIFFDSIYFTITTFFTIGYGDITPENIIGKTIALLVMIQGFMLIIIVFASISSKKQTFNQKKTD